LSRGLLDGSTDVDQIDHLISIISYLRLKSTVRVFTK